MRARSWSLIVLLVVGGVLASAALISRSAPNLSAATGQAVAVKATQEIGGQEEWGPYEVVSPFPQPLPDGPDGVKHDGWTWGSVGAVYAETPDRIWIAQRGELPLPPGSKPWTPYAMLPWKNVDVIGPPSQQPPDAPGRKATGYDDGESASGGVEAKRGWERRYHHSIFAVDRNGKMIDWWPEAEKLFDVRRGRGPHSIKMSPYDPEKHIWIVDDELHMVYKFTHDGKLVQKWGELGVPGRDGNHFSRPTGIDWLPDGTFFISDGYVGTRVAKFDKNGKFLMDWGKKTADRNNPGPNEFSTVHAITISKDRRLFVSDRGNKRIQIFDENGKFLTMFSTGANSSPYYDLISGDQYLWVADGGTQRILKYDLNGHYLYGWGRYGPWLGGFYGPHAMTVDQDKNLYVGDVFGGRVHKFRPKPNADPAKVMQPELKPPMTNRTQ